MKKWVLLVFVLFLIEVVADELETIEIEGNYNYGDILIIKGDYISGIDKREDINIYLICQDKGVSVGFFKLNLKVNANTEFEQTIKIPSQIEGPCNVVLKGTSIEKEIGNIVISRELDGNVVLNKEVFQLGEGLIVSGIIKGFNTENITGLGKIYFIKNNDVLFIDHFNVNNGNVYYELLLKNLAAGKYDLDIEINDLFGNKLALNGDIGFTVSDSLNLNVVTDKKDYLPGELLNIKGNLADNFNLEDGRVLLRFTDDAQFEYEMNNNNFEFSYKLIKNIKSGLHTFKVIVEDINGNYAEQELSLNILPISTRLDLLLDSVELISGQSSGIILELFDQADDKINKQLLVKTDCEDYKQEILIWTNKQEFIEIPYYVKPGVCKINVQEDILFIEKEFNILENKQVDFNVNGEFLVVSNIGNIKYNDDVIIKSKNDTIERKISLGVNETKDIPLYNLLEKGKYQIFVNDKPFEVEIKTDKNLFGSVFSAITGYAVSSDSGGQDIFYILIGIMILVCLAYLLRPKKKITKEKNEKYIDLAVAEKRNDYVERVYSSKEPTVKKKEKYGVATEEDRKDFRERIIKQIRDQEMKDKRMVNYNNQEGMFNLFN